MSTVTLIGVDGSIYKKSPAFIKRKTTSQILKSIPDASEGQYVLGIRTPTYMKILRQDSIPFDLYPGLVSNEFIDLQTIPDYSLQIFNDSDIGKIYFIFKPFSPTNPKIIFPLFTFSFAPLNYEKKKLSDFISDLVKNFGIQISNPKIIFKNKEISPNLDFKVFYKNVSSYVKNCLIQSNCQKMKSIDFHFNIEPDGLKKIELRENILKEILSSEEVYCKTLKTMNNYFSPILKEQKILTGTDHQTIFGPIPQMIQTSVYLSTELSKFQSYSSCVASIFLNMLFDFKKTSSQYFVNYNRMISDIVKLDTNQQVQKICDKTPDNPGISFQSVAIQPIQRFPRYPLLLKELIKNTPESHPDFLPLKQVNERVKLLVHEMSDAYILQEKIDLNKRLVESSEKASLFTQERKFIKIFFVLLKEKLKVKSNLYLFNDLLLLTTGNEKEIIKLRCNYSELSFIPNYPDNLSITFCLNAEYKTIEFSSFEQIQLFLKTLINERNNVFDSFTGQINPSIKSVEYYSQNDQVIQSLIDSSCSKSRDSISIASNQNHFSFKMSNGNFKFENDDIKGIHNHSKIVVIKDNEYMVGGSKSIGPLQLYDNKFNEVKPDNYSGNKKKLTLIEKLGATKINLSKEGRIYHTCCNYNDEYIVVFGGLNPKNSKQILLDIYFYSIETNEWFIYNAPNKPDPRYKHSAVIYKDMMIIHGGINSIQNDILSDIWIFDFLTGNWNLIDTRSERNVVPRFGHAAVIVNHFMFIIGGSTTKYTFPPIQLKTVNLPNDNQNENDADSFIMIDLFDSNNKNRIQKNKRGDFMSDTSVNDSSSDVSKNDDELGPVSFNSKSRLPASNCFCFDIENEKIDNVDIVGNFIHGISMLSAVYDEITQKVIIFGGTNPKNKFEKGMPFISLLDIPNRFKLRRSRTVDSKPIKKAMILNIPDDNSPTKTKSVRTIQFKRRLSHTINPPKLKLKPQNVNLNETQENSKADNNEDENKTKKGNQLNSDENNSRKEKRSTNDFIDNKRRIMQVQDDDSEITLQNGFKNENVNSCSQPKIFLNFQSNDKEDFDNNNIHYPRRMKLKSHLSYDIIPSMRKKGQKQHYNQNTESDETS